MNEEWSPIPGHPHHEISNLARVRSLPRFGRTKGRILKQWVSNTGYAWVTLVENGKNKSCFVHRLMLQAFVGPCPDGKEAAHLDGNPLNNRTENLSWVTPGENGKHRRVHGTQVCGSKSPHSKLSDADVAEIRRLHKRVRQVDLAARYGVARSTIQRVQSGERY